MAKEKHRTHTETLSDSEIEQVYTAFSKERAGFWDLIKVMAASARDVAPDSYVKIDIRASAEEDLPLTEETERKNYNKDVSDRAFAQIDAVPRALEKILRPEDYKAATSSFSASKEVHQEGALSYKRYSTEARYSFSFMLPAMVALDKEIRPLGEELHTLRKMHDFFHPQGKAPNPLTPVLERAADCGYGEKEVESLKLAFYTVAEFAGAAVKPGGVSREPVENRKAENQTWAEAYKDKKPPMRQLKNACSLIFNTCRMMEPKAHEKAEKKEITAALAPAQTLATNILRYMELRTAREKEAGAYIN